MVCRSVGVHRFRVHPCPTDGRRGEHLTGRGAGSEDRFTALAGEGLCWTIDTDELTGKLLLRNGRVDSTSLAQIVRIECADNDARVPRAGFMQMDSN